MFNPQQPRRPMAPAPLPEMRIAILDQGYVVSLDGQTIACATPQQLGMVVTQMMLARQQMMGYSPYAQAWQPVPMPPLGPPPAPRLQGQVAMGPNPDYQPPQAAQPAPPQPVNAGGWTLPPVGPSAPPTGPVPTTTATLVEGIDPAAMHNLQRITEARITGRIGDQEFWEKVANHCPGVSEELAMEMLDSAFGDGAFASPGTPAPRPPAQQLPTNLAGYRPTPAGDGLSWGINVDDFVVDDSTGRRVA